MNIPSKFPQCGYDPKGKGYCVASSYEKCHTYYKENEPCFDLAACEAWRNRKEEPVYRDPDRFDWSDHLLNSK